MSMPRELYRMGARWLRPQATISCSWLIAFERQLATPRQSLLRQSPSEASGHSTVGLNDGSQRGVSEGPPVEFGRRIHH